MSRQRCGPPSLVIQWLRGGRLLEIFLITYLPLAPKLKMGGSIPSVRRDLWGITRTFSPYFEVLLTAHLSIILVINQLNAQYLVFVISLFHASTCFEHYVLIIRGVKIVLYSIWYRHTCRWPSGAQVFSQPVHRTATYRCDDTRCCIIQF